MSRRSKRWIFDIAYRYMGMGHIEVLSCDLSTHRLYTRPDGGSNGYDREINHEVMTKKVLLKIYKFFLKIGFMVKFSYLPRNAQQTRLMIKLRKTRSINVAFCGQWFSYKRTKSLHGYNYNHGDHLWVGLNTFFLPIYFLNVES